MRPRHLYFAIFTWLVFSGGRFTAPFLTNVAHLSDTLTGLALALQTMSLSLFSSIGGAVADHLEKKYPHRGRAMTIVSGLGLSTSAFMLHGAVVHIFQKNSTSKLVMSCHIFLRVIYSIGLSFAMPVLDGLTLSRLVEQGSKKEDFGKERLYGAVSWAVSSVILGPLIDRYGFEVMLLSAPLAFLYCLATITIFTTNTRNIGISKTTNDAVSENIVEASHSCLGVDESDPKCQQYIPDKSKRNFTWLLLLSMCSTVYGAGYIFSSVALSMGTSVVESLIFLFFETLGSTSTMCGLTVAVTVMFEIPIFQLAPKLLEIFGPEKLQEIACMAYITRVVGYTFIPQNRMWMVLFLEPLHGVTYACAKTSQVEFAARLAPKGYESSSQGILSSVIGVGSLIGLSLGGWVEDTLGAKVMYRGFATVVLAGLVVLLIAGQLHRKSMESNHEEKKPLVFLDRLTKRNYSSVISTGGST
mmetsp:Transcript_8963/g.13070  ORF Transcript_8963/g.13070 Transcript_8963/m.13070 type:complete len:471 (-) Transcript_8963:29-1441(-)